MVRRGDGDWRQRSFGVFRFCGLVRELLGKFSRVVCGCNGLCVYAMRPKIEDENSRVDIRYRVLWIQRYFAYRRGFHSRTISRRIFSKYLVSLVCHDSHPDISWTYFRELCARVLTSRESGTRRCGRTIGGDRTGMVAAARGSYVESVLCLYYHIDGYHPWRESKKLNPPFKLWHRGTSE